MLRQLGPSDAAAIHALFAACADFFALIHEDAAHEAERIFDDVPPNTRPDQKLVFGVFADELVGLVELLRDYPSKDDWCLGLLLVSPTHRGAGLGSRIVDRVVRFMCDSNARTIQLVVQAQNPGALRFWQRHGFSIRDHSTQSAARGTNEINVLVREMPR